MFDTHFKPRTLVSRLAALAAAGFLAATVSAFAQNDSQAVIANRITQTINPDKLVTLQHNVHPLAQARFDQGAASGSLATGRIMLVLKRSDTHGSLEVGKCGDCVVLDAPSWEHVVYQFEPPISSVVKGGVVVHDVAV